MFILRAQNVVGASPPPNYRIAADPGLLIQPVHVHAQLESAVVYDLSAALTEELTIKDGAVQQHNFNDYPVLRINQMPRIETYIVPSREKPTGVGEPATPVIAPALANAILAMEGKPVRALPLSTQGIAFA